DPPTDVPGDPVAQPLLVAGSTIADNTGGALLLTEDTTVDVIASIVQAADGVPACTGPQASLTDLGFNIVSDPSCGVELESTVVGDPQLGPLADNGGPSQTMLPAAESPALDLVPVGTSAPWAGSSIELCPGTFDQRGDGFPRHVRTGCDAGAVELAGAVLTVTASDATYAGEPGPTVTPSYAGFVNGDSAADLDTLPTCSFDVDAAITLCSGAEDDVSSFSYVDGTLTVLEPVEILTESLPVGTVGEDYAVTLEATGGDGAPYTWAITDGGLPTGVSLNSGTGEISGVPEEAGDFDLTVSADGDATKAFTLMVSGPVLTVTASDATTYEGAFEPEITASYTGFLPGDSEADLETLPTCTYDMGAATTSCSGAADDLYSFEYVNGTLTVLDPLVIVTESLPGATVGEEYSVTLEATGGDGGPYLWGIHAGSLPAGLQIDSATGEISGIPETAGPVTFTVFVGDPILKEFTLEVAAAPTQPTTPPTTDEPSATDPPATDDPSTDGQGTDGRGAVDDGAEGLPGTGIDGLGATALALAVMMLGAALVLVARRRRQLG
ncbi:putative Ig domain-containing protein, partial [Pseudactinotalea sp.]|uniref:putative Ig domain-containing protein n=1 Tax=Pseudactinotalea sp. TaxID=1926260 RepID=UPI003B3B6BE7